MTRDEGDDARRVSLGRVVGPHGVRGWVKVESWTRPRENILGFACWHLAGAAEERAYRVLDGRHPGKALAARLEGVDDRDAALALAGLEIRVRRDALPPAEEGEYYWWDLEGLRVETPNGVTLGVVDHLVETGANDVLVVRGERERLIPFVPGEVVIDVDLEAGRLRVDWDPEL